MNPSMNGDYEEALRRALHAAADSIEPSADGLEPAGSYDRAGGHGHGGSR